MQVSEYEDLNVSGVIPKQVIITNRKGDNQDDQDNPRDCDLIM